jgi:hypothetical protein
MWSAVRRSLAAAAVTLAFTVPVSAQQRMSGDQGLPPLTAPMRAKAPILPSNVLGATVDLEVVRPVIALPVAMQRQRQNVALMIVGGAALIVGSVIDGDTGIIIMAGGGILGLVGLFRYLH